MLLAMVCSPAMAEGAVTTCSPILCGMMTIGGDPVVLDKCFLNGHVVTVEPGMECSNIGAVPIASPVKSCLFNGGMNLCRSRDGVSVELGTLTGDGTNTVTGTEYGCQPNEERVLRSDFSVGCAKGVHPQTWH
jgi:hypothetical protein